MQALAAALDEGVVEPLLLAVVLVVLALVVVNIWLIARVRQMRAGYLRLTKDATGESLEQLLGEHMERVVAALARAEEVSGACQQLGRRVDGCLQRVGVVRFDAFDDVGGQMSFALALLDDTANGVVISSLHGRRDTRLFVKPVRDGRSEVALTTEEVEALRQVGIEATPSRLTRVTRAGNGS